MSTKDSFLLMLGVLGRQKPGHGQLNCYKCKHRLEVPGNAHIACAKPCARVTGDPHGIANGWFMYPLLFDPTWGSTPCSTFESAETVSPAVSDPVSRETV